MTKVAFNLVYCGENERPVRALNFRGKDKGGLGMIDPKTKADALMVKTMYKKQKKEKIEEKMIQHMYGHVKSLQRIIDLNRDDMSSKEVYEVLIKDKIENNGSLIHQEMRKESMV